MIDLLRPNKIKRILFFILTDILLSIITLYGAYLLRFNFNIPEIFLESSVRIAFLLIALKIASLALWKNYTIVWRFYGLRETKKLLYALITTYLIFIFVFLIFKHFFAPFPRSVVIIDFFLSLSLLGGLRFAKRFILETGSANKTIKSTLIIGISPQTSYIVKSSMDGLIDYYPLAIVAVREANKHMVGSTIHNLGIIDIDSLPQYIHVHDIDSVIIDNTLIQEDLQRVYSLLQNTQIKDIKRFNLLNEHNSKIESLSIEELLARHPKDLDTKTIERFIKGKKILITGGGGSIGSEIALQSSSFGASQIILVDHSEFNLYQIGERIPNAELKLCNILNADQFDLILEKYEPDIIIHAAAYKHVPICEENPYVAVENNIVGSINVIDSAIKHKTKKVVIISTDKAVRPTNVMGATKRVVELYAQNVDSDETKIAVVRFGNVLGSSGSVIPKFKAQIESGGPLTITHPDITRYFMLINEACQLVLQAAAIADGGELLILDMGEPVRIQALAETMIRLYAKRPIEIIYSGLRPGEKLYEELLLDESERKTVYESITIAGSSVYDINRLKNDIKLLINSLKPIQKLQEIVPEYTPDGRSQIGKEL